MTSCTAWLALDTLASDDGRLYHAWGPHHVAFHPAMVNGVHCITWQSTVCMEYEDCVHFCIIPIYDWFVMRCIYGFMALYKCVIITIANIYMYIIYVFVRISWSKSRIELNSEVYMRGVDGLNLAQSQTFISWFARMLKPPLCTREFSDCGCMLYQFCSPPCRWRWSNTLSVNCLSCNLQFATGRAACRERAAKPRGVWVRDGLGGRTWVNAMVALPAHWQS